MIDNELQDLIKRLRIVYFAMLGLLLVQAAVVEFVLLDIEGGQCVGDAQLEFVSECVAIALTLGGAYLALRLIKFKCVMAPVLEDPIEGYLPMSVTRMMLLFFPMGINIFGYMLFLNASFCWMGAMLLLCWPFLYPTAERFYAETQTNPENPAS